MSKSEIERMSDQVDFTTEIECEHCGYVWDTESGMPRVTCPSCQRKTDRKNERESASIPTRYVGDKETLDEVAALYDERATLVRRLYEEGWSTNLGVDGPNFIRAVPESQTDGTDSDRPPITDEGWSISGPSDDAASGIGRIEYVCKCPQCGTEFTVDFDDWDTDAKIVSENEVFCFSCGSAVTKNLVAIEFVDYPKFRFDSIQNLRNAAFKLRGLAAWLRSLEAHGWYLDQVRSQYLHIRFDVSSENKFTLNSRGHLQNLSQ